MFSRRDTELGLMILAALPVLAVFALVETQADRAFSWTSLAIPASLLAAFLIAHIATRRFAPGADPGLMPIAFVLAGLGLAFVTRLDRSLAASQIVWLFVGVAGLIGVLVLVPSLERLARYKYTIGLAGILLLIAPAIVGREINGAKLWIRVGGMSFQPGELAKICIVLFLAAYLAENREMLSVSTRRVLGMRLPEPRTLGPLLLMWAASLFVLVFERDLGSSLLLFGTFLVMVYVATGRPSFVIVGLGLFGAGATVAWRLFDHVQTRVAIWLDPFADASGRGYQLVQSLFALGAGGLLGVGPGRGMPERIPFAETDFIFSAIGEELGLLGAAAVVTCFLVFTLRGISTAARARSDVAGFVAAGLVANLALQAFVIVGGVTRLIPLTGVTLPFVSYGGSSLLSTFIALGLLLLAGNESTGVETEMRTTRVDLGVLGRVALGRRLTKVAITMAVLLSALVVNLTYLQVFRADALAASPTNTRGIAEQMRAQRGEIRTRDGMVLARSVENGPGTYRREYPQHGTAAHVVGYSSAKYGRAGIESVANDILTGERTIATWKEAVESAAGLPVPGDDVVLTIDSTVQKAAESALGDRTGAIVVLDPRSGAVLASASNPGFDPGLVDSQWETLSGASGATHLLDRTRQALYAPGSTFKVVTLTGAYSSGVATPKSTYSGPGSIEIGNAPITNFEGGSYGKMDLITATARSVNTVFAQLADELGAQRLVEQAKRFGFTKKLSFELPVKTSLMPDPDEMTEWETAWAGVGQPVGEHDSPAGPQATVLQMALIAAGIGNDGVVMRPYIIDRIDPSADSAAIITGPRKWLVATDKATADQVTDAMVKVVRSGSGTRAAVDGVKVAGKTGTAEVAEDAPTNAWFIAFAPAENPTVAIAVVIEGGGIGGRVAAPAARPVLEAALRAQGDID